tara:strand:+ start:185 stop:316 length:132 start_codon:yes stop_codon:yes gene_type:complete
LKNKTKNPRNIELNEKTEKGFSQIETNKAKQRQKIKFANIALF